MKNTQNSLFRGNLICAVLISVFSFQSIAQESPQRGHVVLENGNRLEGWLIATNGKNRYSVAYFSPTSTGQVTEYRPDQIREYGIGNSYKFWSTHFYPSMSDEYEEERFLELVVEGKLCLLADDGPVFSLYKQEGGLYKILENAELTELPPEGIKEQDYVDERYANTGIFVNLISDCLPIAAKVSNGVYPFEQNAKLLGNIVHDYNLCQNSPSNYYLKGRKKIGITAYLGSGVSFNRPWFISKNETAVDGGPTFDHYNYPISGSALLNGGIDVWFPSLWQQMAISLPVSYGNYQYGGSYFGPVYEGASDSVSSILDLQFSSLIFSPSLKVIFAPQWKWGLYGSFGTVLRFNQHRASTLDFYRFNFLQRPNPNPREYNLAEFQFGLTWTLGLQAPTPKEWPVRFSLEYRGLISDTRNLIDSHFRENGLYILIGTPIL